MPFTPSHALVALPFVRTPLVPAAIAIGAMTPDLPLFLRGVGPTYGFTHSAANVVWTALIALVLFTLWRVVLRPALVMLAPDAVAARMPREWLRSDGQALRGLVTPRSGESRAVAGALLAASLVLGVLSHIAWDMFTHEGRWGVVTLTALQQPWGPLPWYKWLQRGSGVIGLLALALYGVLWGRRRPVARRPRMLPTPLRWVWYLTLPTALITGWSIGLVRFGPPGQALTLQQFAYRTLPPACGVWGAMTLVLCVVVVLTATRRPAHAA
ncbi:DUF4184 family protein [Microbacterium sp. ARD32]|uniref:DUF4184 family protein n=1 Tax=Microbacterium sp. ARD32 TaxID=2962577 RepID=UPI002880D255|nr:DUF4184 family protein [Microbacterium sp. ARD32]MDT0158575.1 DUF4184 family protein [Microbacterium sp. ARD32]